MKRNIMMFVLVAAALCAVGAYAEDAAPSADKGQTATQTKDQTAQQKKDERKAAWENGVKTDCAAEIAPGGVCAGKDFSTGLEKCLHKNRKKLSDGCKATVHHHNKGSKDKKSDAPADGAKAPAAQAPAAAPQK